jgi:hypothetical protein
VVDEAGHDIGVIVHHVVARPDLVDLSAGVQRLGHARAGRDARRSEGLHEPVDPF